MPQYTARGLPVDWLNAWLAAIGITVLVPGTRLAWTDDPVPKAILHWPGDGDLADLVAAHLPSTEELDQLVIAGLPQNMQPDQYREAAARARANRDDPSLGVLTTDLATPSPKGELLTGPFNVGAPRGETLFLRLRACRRALDGDETLSRLVAASLDGGGRRHAVNGLGFDYRRMAASVAAEATKYADPVVECLCFYGLSLHPMGGNGTHGYQRGWNKAPTRRRAFTWPAWQHPLDRWGIDALLDVVYRDTSRQASSPKPGAFSVTGAWRRLGVTRLYGSIPFQRTGSSDAARGYASDRLT